VSKLISCDQHDHFEIACMHRSRVSLTLRNKEVLNGVAQTLVNKNGREWLKISVANTTKVIELNSVNQMDYEGNTVTIK